MGRQNKITMENCIQKTVTIPIKYLHVFIAYGQEEPETLARVTVKELWENCLSPTFAQTVENLIPLLLLCFVFKLICSFSKTGISENK